jgi:pimeloyl-ACP methyl ester carboxylesterase
MEGAVATLLGLTTAAVPVTAAQASAVPVTAARAAALTWHACGDGLAADCATLTLPANWSRPGGETFGLSVARRRATDQAHRVGTLVFGPGGPGDSGVSRVTDDGNFDRFSDEVRRRFDIVSFDPRGVGGSRPITCPASSLPEPPRVLADQADFDATLAYNRDYWDGCRERTGPVFDHADTASTVRDLEALRAALGERQLTFHGSSYGTLLGELYAERYPARVRAIVLESVVDHRPAGTGQFLAEQAWALQDSFDAFVAWCDRESSCALHGRDVQAIWAGLRADADAGRLDMTPFDLVGVTHGGVKAPDYPRLAQTLAGLADRSIPGIRVTNLNVVTPAFCNDWSLPVRDYADYAAILRRSAAVAPDVRYPAQVFALTMCLGWPRPVADPQHVLRVHTAVPLVLLNSRHDPATGYNWATSVAHQLGRHGVLVTYAGAGHGSYDLGNDCMQQAADRYLISLTVPRRGTVCRPQ